MAGEEDTRPVKSPYGGRQAVLHFYEEREQSELRVPFNVLEPHKELTRKRKRDEAGTSDGPSCEEFDLTDTPFSVGHVIVHFLLTGTYQTLRFWRLDLEWGRAQEFRTAICVYAAAVEKKLPGLRDLARLQIAKLGEQIDLELIITVIDFGRPVSNSLFGTLNPGINGYLRFKVQSFVKNVTEAEAKDMLAKLKGPKTLSKTLLESLILMRIPTGPKPEEGTGPKMDDASAAKNNVQLAEMAILQAEDAHQKDVEESNRRFRRFAETGKTRKGMEGGHQGQPRAA
ncbi:hypothetical protein NW752_007721 [Fusarium irregulare]|uniref:Uncharacterized protein n=1 Tax=Fusarium irregulare TaxID=2494466 RepID=A0A9W8PI16_9HYPO|nr:hypothetical protein NW766_009982 [Fusarium irregulare]KAJ4013423.1 hypothetical protein NW752_007721 [Fusarium irregulare]